MGVRLAVATLTDSGADENAHVVPFIAGSDDDAALRCPTLRVREPLSLEATSIVQFALERKRRNGLRAIDTNDHGRPPHPTLPGERVDAIRAFMSRPIWLLSRACVLLLACSMGAGTAFATAAALPGDLLYSVKAATDELRVALARSPQSRASVELSIALSRLHEALALEALGRDADARAAMSAYREHAAVAAAIREAMRPTSSVALAAASSTTVRVASTTFGDTAPNEATLPSDASPSDEALAAPPPDAAVAAEPTTMSAQIPASEPAAPSAPVATMPQPRTPAVPPSTPTMVTVAPTATVPVTTVPVPPTTVSTAIADPTKHTQPAAKQAHDPATKVVPKGPSPKV
jgi:hypothetical protein